MQFDYGHPEYAGVSWTAGFQPTDGWSVAAEFRLGKQRSKETDQHWNFKSEMRFNTTSRRRQGELAIFVPV